MTSPGAHIAVCVCTFKRPELLRRLLAALDRQDTRGAFSYSVVVADNDKGRSAENVVSGQASVSPLRIVYCVEPRQNIALARNAAVRNATGDYIAFIDDDEVPEPDWLHHLFKVCSVDPAIDGVLGPVRPCFEHEPPAWVVRGRFFDRPEHETGHRLGWAETRSGNVLLRREILEGASEPFRAEFGSGSEDVDFFRRMIRKGRVFVWCREAAVREWVPPARCQRIYQMRQALLRGGNALKHKGPDRILGIVKSLVAVPAYSIALPVVALLGEHRLMKGLVSLCDHAGKVLTLLGLNPVKARDVSSDAPAGAPPC